MDLDIVQKLQDLQSQAVAHMTAAKTKNEMVALVAQYTGKNSLLFEAGALLKTALPEQKRVLGQAINTFRTAINAAAENATVGTDDGTNIVRDPIRDDSTLPGERPPIGHLHPTTMVIRKINSFFRYMGYSVYEGPEIESNEFNFEKLNLPKDHPARELADTFYIRDPEVLLRTHTSSVETRAMSTESLPLRIVVPGKVYRNENSNTTNTSMFHQYEGLLVDKGVRMSDLKGTLNRFVRFLYGDDVKTRFRCKYYPQVEPGAGMDIQCSFCGGTGCSVCKYRGWIEVLGCGMVHPNVLNACGIDPTEYSGFAFGMGLDRLVMLTYGINDIRKLYNGELFYEDTV
ncbi:MAG: phenylalanine--tRNA ligase subunit alpha [Candidatus Woesebacteria bacterium]